MISINNNINSIPLKKLISFYYKAYDKNQQHIEAACLSTSSETNMPDSRFLNIKYINESGLIFFSNYNSPKAVQLDNNPYISLVFFWSSINTQIRIKAKIKKTSKDFNDNYFKNRAIEKNALSISSAQSKIATSFKDIKTNYEKTLKSNDLLKCPEYWGGFSFTPYEIEFWKGNAYRLNKRDLYTKKNGNWNHFVLEP